jgi:hypothetical protein
MMVCRAYDLDLIDKDEMKLLWRNLNRRGWKRREPLDDEIEIEEPIVLNESLKLMVESGGSNFRSKFLFDIKLNHLDVEQLMGLPRHYLDPNRGQLIDLSNHISLRKSFGTDSNQNTYAANSNENFQNSNDDKDLEQGDQMSLFDLQPDDTNKFLKEALTWKPGRSTSRYN